MVCGMSDLFLLCAWRAVPDLGCGVSAVFSNGRELSCTSNSDGSTNRAR